MSRFTMFYQADTFLANPTITISGLDLDRQIRAMLEFRVCNHFLRLTNGHSIQIGDSSRKSI